ncbi:sigma-70 family RNA polymerase sigma factor [Chitinophaga sedimenti]|uniref:RNA polymerase sigma factor n=1 Tax=Chitinophaga sedimenti TaxID=2033606 RepID=UPI0020033F27|nr:sigma-70 family RNA polymerase sigma factor [Chitinophaga sedimenti]MCK7556367.1 sigma-70 family RNA polymerase sigma factor [Chitinophaga sedimenti]
MGISPVYSERELLERVAGRDQQAFRIVYNTYGKKVYTYALQLLHSEFEAEEMVQDVFLKIWLMGDRIREISSLEAYLRTLTKHRSLNALRRMALDGRIEKALGREWREENSDLAEEMLIKDIRGVLNRAIEALPKQQKRFIFYASNRALNMKRLPNV